MSIWSRFTNIFRPGRMDSEIDEELLSHLEQAVEDGREEAEARKAFGSLLRYREEARDIGLLVWLDSLRADLVFGWRQLKKNRVTSVVAVLSLGLAIGACGAAFRLMDALLWRPMPVANAYRLYAMFCRGVGPDGSMRDSDSNEYPQFQLMRASVKDDGELIAASWVDLVDLTYGPAQEMEKANLQYVSGWMFSSFGLKPAIGRLLTEMDDRKPRMHPYAVLSYDYWTRRFGGDRTVIGQTFRVGPDQLQIIGVLSPGFTGTETGLFTDIFLPTMMHAGVTHDDWSWIRTFIQLKPEGNTDRIAERLGRIWKTVQTERAKSFTDWPQERLGRYLDQKVIVEPAGSGLSEMSSRYRVALAALAVIVALVLMIAAVNIANLMTAQAAVRSREMALRVSIGAGRARLLQMMAVESALITIFSSVLGGLFAWWSAPFIVSRINPADQPARLALTMDWRILSFAVALCFLVTIAFGLLPALRASSVRPAAALKGGLDPHSRRRLMHALLAAQVAFCFLVHFGASLFVDTLNKLSHQLTGFSSERLLTLQATTEKAQPAEAWFQVAAHLRELPGVERAALAGWPLLSGTGANGFVSVDGAPPGSLLGYFLNVSPGWLDTLKIPLIAGRDFRPDDVSPGVAIVNQAFVRDYFHGSNPLGRSFDRGKQHYKVIGVVPNARYRNMREPMTATAYIPLRSPAPAVIDKATFLVKTFSTNPLTLADRLRREVTRARSEFRVSSIRTQLDINQAQTVRERLLAMLAIFFAAVALLLAAIGLYGILSYSVLQRRREFGIRIAIGAPARDIISRVTGDVFTVVALGSIAGACSGFLLQPYVASLLYQTNRFEASALIIPLSIIFVATSFAAIPAVVRALKIDAASLLRTD